MAGWLRKKRSRGKTEQGGVGDYELPNFPAAVLAVLRILRTDESTNAEIAHALEADPGMTVRLLRLVNSAGFGLRHAVEDVGQAVQLIGRSSLESILIGAAVQETLPSDTRPGFDPDAFWRLAAQRATVASALAVELCPERRSLCWTAGLLQDLAVPLLVQRNGDDYCALLERWGEGEGSLEELERESLQTDHAEVAREICTAWAFPEALTEALAGHHEPPGDDPLPERLVAPLRPGHESKDGEPDGIPELIAAAESAGVARETAEGCVERGLAEAEPLFALLH